MAELTYEQKLKLQNSTAHLQKVLEDIVDANKLLTATFAQKESAAKGLSSLREEIEVAAAQLGKINDAIAAAETAFLAREADIERKDRALDEKAHAQNAEHNRQLSALADAVAEAKASIEAAREERNKFVSESEALAGKIAQMNLEVEALEVLEVRVQELHTEIRELTRTIDDLRASNQQEKTTMEKHLATLREELATTQTRVAEEMAKIHLPRQVLAEEEAKLQVKLRNFRILRERLEKHFKILLPNLSTNNLGLE